ncbi:DNA-directed RNA polymerase III subunit 2-like [Cucurbita moschata]|uniref:DNA-directed RNA polymerase n=1 Tax=Cucurbita moschata TaxID=3662 RepID=A0A6J1H055_CUCMO|nr:DNA-directed RNA polymerase III subunit 2-like [Cucurbita moschata]XP_022957414.1 DNA-directed RNA polymerase III subunit 2-like [Cucurbita moschata]
MVVKPSGDASMNGKQVDDPNPIDSVNDKQFFGLPIKTAVDKFQLLPEFLKVRGLVKRHLDSFNYFANIEIKKIVKANYLIDSSTDPSILSFPDVRIGEPYVTVNAVSETFKPHTCCLSDLTYNRLPITSVYIYGTNLLPKVKTQGLGQNAC